MMKRLSLILVLLSCATTMLAQFPSKVPSGSPTTFNWYKGAPGSDSGYVFNSQYMDTAQANFGFLDGQAGLVIKVDDQLWMRSYDVSRWIPIGGQGVAVGNTNTVLLSGIGTDLDPILADVLLSSQSDNILIQLSDGLYVQNQIQNGIISGGIRTWVSGYTYDITEAKYAIAGVVYVAPTSQVTLDNADPTFNRIDLIVANNDNTITAITGVASANPEEPSYDPTTQVPLGFVVVTANTTEPPVINQDYIYLNNAEWTTLSSTARINPASTNNPYSPGLDIEATLAQNSDNISFTDPTQPTDMSNFLVLTMKLRSKATWGANSRLEFRFYNDGLPVGVPVSLGNNSFGFTSSNVSSYQTISIQKQLFGALTDVDYLLITVKTAASNTIGFYLDDIQLQGLEGTFVPNNGLFWAQGGNAYGTTGVIGTLDNNPVNWIINNTLHTTLLTNGSTWFRGSDPGLSFSTATFAGSDYFLKKTGTTMFLNSAGGFALQIAGNNAYILNAVNGHIWNNTSAVPQMALSPTGAFKLNAYGDNTFTGTATRWLAVDVNGNVIEEAPPAAATVITADNGVTASSSTNVQLGGTLIQNTTITTGSSFRLTVTGSNTGFPQLSVLGTGATGTALAGIGSNAVIGVQGVGSTGIGVLGTSTSGAAGVFSSISGIGMQSSSAGNYGASITRYSGTNDDVIPVIQVSRVVTGLTPAVGLGGSILFTLHPTTGGILTSNRLTSKWLDPTTGSTISQFIITGVNSGVEADLFTLSGSGALRFNKYGINTFAGTATYILGVDVNGNVIEIPTSGGGVLITADNGLTANTATNVQLGGTLVQNTQIADNGFTLLFTNNTGTNTLAATNSSSGNAISASANSGSGGAFLSTSGTAVNAISTSGTGILAQSTSSLAGNFIVNPASTNTIEEILRIQRQSSGTPANGIGGSIRFYIETDAGTSEAASIAATLTDAASGTRTGDLQFWTTNLATSAIKATLAGSGALRLHNYGTGAIGGTATFSLSVDVNGNIIETALGGAGFTNPMGAIGDIITSSDGAGTPVAISPGAAGTVLTSNGAGAQPTYQALAGSGTVTSVAQSFTGGLISVAGSPITGSGTLALTVAGTSGGIPYFSSASTWASSAELTANAIMIGGGAGTAPSTTTTGTGVLTALGVNVGSAGAFVIFDGALGTPLSGVATNLTGTATALSIGGNAATATILQTARTINGTSFDGSINITITAAAGTLTGTILNSTVVTSSLTSVGTIATGVWQGTAIDDTYISSASTWNAKQTGDATLTALAGLTITNGSIIVGTGADAFSVLAIGTANQVLRVNAGATALEWSSVGSGTVTSVAMSVPSFLSVSGSPITTSGTLAVTLSGTALPVANGGTGLTSSGTANQILGMNNGASALEYKTVTVGAGMTITHGAGSVTISNNFNPTVQTLTDGATITWTVANGGNAKVTLAGTGRTLVIPDPVAGYTYTVEITQGSGGSKTISTWPTGTTWSGPNTLSTTAGDVDVVVLYWNGTNYRAVLTTDYN